MDREEMRILVVEDEKLVNWSLTSSLLKWGFEATPVFTGTDAIAQIESNRFDIVLLDYRLPDIDGLEIARLMRKKQPEAVVFLLTAFQLNEISVEPGLIDSYFNKPLDLQQLRLALEEIPRLRGDRKTRTLMRYLGDYESSTLPKLD